MTDNADRAVTEVETLLESYVREGAGRPADGFAAGCHTTAGGYEALLRLRRALATVGFEPIPFNEYLERLAYAGGAAVAKVRALLGKKAEHDSGYAHLGQLGAALRMPLRQVLVHIQLQFLADAGALRAVHARRAECMGSESLALTERQIAEAAEELNAEGSRTMETVARTATQSYREAMGE